MRQLMGEPFSSHVGSLFLRRLRTALICAVPEQQHGRSLHETAGTSPRGFSRAIGFVWRINSVERRGASWCQAPIARARERGQLASCARAAASTGAEEVWGSRVHRGQTSPRGQEQSGPSRHARPERAKKLRLVSSAEGGKKVIA